MIINGFGNSGGNGLLDEQRWKDIVVFSQTNYAISSMSTSNAPIQSKSDAADWDYEVLQASTLVKFVCNTWTWSGTHTASPSTSVLLQFSMQLSDSNSYMANAPWFFRRYYGYVASTSTSIETLRQYTFTSETIERTRVNLMRQNSIYYFCYLHTTSNEVRYVLPIERGINEDGSLKDTITGPRLYGYRSNDTVFANTKLTYNISLKGYVG